MATSEAPACFEPDEPEYATGECPTIGVGGNHSAAYSDDGEWKCDFCGARPKAPVQACVNPLSLGWTRFWPRMLSAAESLHLYERHGVGAPGPCEDSGCPLRDAREVAP